MPKCRDEFFLRGNECMYRLVKTVALIFRREMDPSLIRFIVELIGARSDILADTFWGMENWKPLNTFVGTPELEEGCLMMLRHHRTGLTRVAFLEEQTSEWSGGMEWCYGPEIFLGVKYFFVNDVKPRYFTSGKGYKYPIWSLKPMQCLPMQCCLFADYYCGMESMYAVMIDEDRKYAYVPRLIGDNNRRGALLDVVGYI